MSEFQIWWDKYPWTAQTTYEEIAQAGWDAGRAALERELTVAREALELAPEPPDPENLDEIESFDSDYADWYAQRRNTALAAK